MSSIVIVGAQWGDEGKGKVVDVLAERADVVVRFQGGNNAGHTLIVGGRKTVVHLVPSGVLRPDALNVIGEGVVVDPDVLGEEMALLAERGLMPDPARSLRVSASAAVIMPYHRRLDALRETRLGAGRIGTTGRGIGPAYEDVAARRAVRVGDLLDRGRLEARLDRVLEERSALLAWYGDAPIDRAALVEAMLRHGERLAPCVADTGRIVRRALSDGRQVVFEGAQGVLLDVLHGTYPFVTSSCTTSAAVAQGAGVPPSTPDAVIAIAKAYTTRVGAGPFPTELHDAVGERLRVTGHEVGATTGRPRRCGWLDLAGLRYAHRLCGFTGLAVTKLDVLGGLGELQVCVAYDVGGERLDELPLDALARGEATPIYETLPGWSADIRAARRVEDLPPAAVAYVRYIEEALDVPVVAIGVGPDRAETIWTGDPWLA